MNGDNQNNQYQEVDMNSNMDQQIQDYNQNYNSGQMNMNSQDYNNGQMNMNSQNYNNDQMNMNNQNYNNDQMNINNQDYNNGQMNMNNQDYNNGQMNMNNQDYNNGSYQVSDEYQPDNNGFDNNQNTGFEYNNSGDFNEKKPSLFSRFKWPIIIILGIIIIIIIIILLAKGCSNSDGKQKLPYDNEYTLVQNAAKDFFEKNGDEPTAYGECKTVTIEDLVSGGYLDLSKSEKLNTCDETETYVNACKLESGNINYGVIFSCTDSTLNNNYGEWEEGNEGNLTDYSDVKFSFLAQKTEMSEEVAASQEELWKDEITYPEGSYTVISSQKLYHYREATWHWTSSVKTYYPSNTTIERNATSFYLTAPNAEYSNKGTEKTVFKWYINSHEKYPTLESMPPTGYTVQGQQGDDAIYASPDKPSTESYRTIYANQTIYMKRNVVKVTDLTTVKYACKNAAGQNKYDIPEPCDQYAPAVEAGLTITFEYKCYYGGSSISSSGWQTSPCKPKLYDYDDWTYHADSCTVSVDEPIICQTTTGYIWHDHVWEWFTPAKKSYYPSGSLTSAGETTYYENSPVANAVRDEATKTTGYNWYKIVSKDFGYAKTQPDKDAVKGSQGWTEWSQYSTTKPAAASNRQIEERELVKLSRTAQSGDIKYIDLTDDYVSEEEVIRAVQDAGYEDVYTLSDILNNSDLSYKVKMYYRNAK